jgi:hypothetical protein
VKTLLRAHLRAHAALACAALVVAAAVLVVARPGLGDYAQLSAANPDNAAPALDALVRGEFARVPSVQPVMGPVSLLVRAPFAAAGHALGDRTLEYRLGALACLWALAALALLLAVRVRRRDGGIVAPAAIVLVVVANPLALAALDAGHPEELLAGALAAAAVLAAADGRATVTGLLIGLAVATKPWAALAAPPALLALRTGRRRALLLAVGVFAALVAPLAAADPHRLLDGTRHLAHAVRVYPASAWWPLAIDHAAPAHEWAMPWGLTRSAGQLLVGALALGAAVVHARRSRGLRGEAALALLAALLLARCVLDPMDLGYYAAPCIAALAAWDASHRRGLPIAALLASVLGWATVLHPVASAPLASALFLAWSVPLALALLGAGWLKVPHSSTAASGRSRTRSAAA